MSSKVIQARIPSEVYEQAATVIRATGLSISDVVRVFMTHIAREKAIPQDIFHPNAETLEAMRECQEGRGQRVTIEEIAAMIEQELTCNRLVA